MMLRIANNQSIGECLALRCDAIVINVHICTEYVYVYIYIYYYIYYYIYIIIIINRKIIYSTIGSCAYLLQ
jgi:hypothetical protein